MHGVSSDDDESNAIYVDNTSRGTNLGGSGIHNNVSNLIHNKWQDLLYEGGKIPSYKNAFLRRPLITERMIVNTYITVKGRVWDQGSLRLDV